MDISQLATLENAKLWAATQEQFVFCVDLMEISAWDDNCDALVDKLEGKFEALLNGEEV